VTESDAVGSVAEEAVKLLRALGAQQQPGAATDEPAEHVCTATWCPLCQVVGFVKDNPEAVAQVTSAAAVLTRALRDIVDAALTPQEEQA
jgi:hypothetical protein